LNQVRRYLDKRKGQGVYIVQFFNAAGSYYFRLPENRQHQTNEYLEAERRYAQNRSLTPDVKSSFPNPINLDGLAAFISKNLSEDRLAACMTEFGIPSAATREKDKFARALAVQFSMFVTSPEDDVDNAVCGIYQKLLAGQPISADDVRGPRTPGDDVYVGLEGRHHAADCYEIIHHEWKLQNCGKIPWENRRLVLVNQADIHPRPVQAIIPLSDARPGEQIKIATDIDARGFEGDYECKWEMQDANGENCFPNKSWDFNIRIHVAFNAMAGGEERG
jgi:hypothetical protein